jgi:hypothetical protein
MLIVRCILWGALALNPLFAANIFLKAGGALPLLDQTYLSPIARSVCVGHGLVGFLRRVPVPISGSLPPYSRHVNVCGSVAKLTKVSHFLLCAAEQQAVLKTLRDLVNAVDSDGNPVLDPTTRARYEYWLNHKTPWGAYNPDHAWPQAYSVANVCFPLQHLLKLYGCDQETFKDALHTSFIPGSVHTLKEQYDDRPLLPTGVAIKYLEDIIQG